MISMGQRRRPVASSVQTGRIPAPVGMNTVSAGPTMGDEDAVYIYNMVSGELGLRVRNGYRYTATGLTGAADNVVRSMLPFTGSTAAKNRLFAVTDTGIYDVTAGGVISSAAVSFASSANNAGRGVATVVVTSAGHFLLYADEENGLYQYTESTDSWAASAITGITGGVAAVVFVAVWKHRVWLVLKDSTKAFYLTAGAVTGAAAGSIDFAQRFKAGGFLVGLWSWTYDGGAGIDDSLVAISSGGDVAIYQGTDPISSSTFAIKGVWGLGAVPVGRKIATDTGGELLIVSALGLLPASKLVAGGAGFSSQYATAKIGNLFSQLMSSYRNVQGWGMCVHPGDAALLVTVPEYGVQSNTTQLAMSFTSGGWSRYRDLPVTSSCVWDGEFYFGTSDGKVARGIDYVDAVPVDLSSTTAIKYSMLSRFNNLGSSSLKRVELVKPVLLSGQLNPLFETTARFDHNTLEPAEPSGTSSGGASAWDEGLWDTALWGGDYVAQTSIRGATGIGRDVAIALRGQAKSRTTLAGIDVWFQQGGGL